MKNKNLKNSSFKYKKLILVLLLVATLFLVILLLVMQRDDNSTQNTSPSNAKAAQTNIEFTERSATQLVSEGGEQDNANVKAEVVNGRAVITVATGYEKQSNSSLKVSKVSLDQAPPYHVLTIEVNHDLSDALGSPVNPRIVVEVPDIKPGKFKVKAVVSKRTPNFTEEGVKMETTNKKELGTEFSYNNR